MKCLHSKIAGILLLLCLLWSCSLLGQTAPDEGGETEETFLVEKGDGKGKVSGPSGNYHDDPEEGEGEEEEEREEDDQANDQANDKAENINEEIPDVSPPETVFLSWKAVSESELVFEFSQPVMVLEVNISPSVNIGSVEDGENTVRVILEETLEPGQWYEAVITAEDQYEKVVNAQVSFRFRPGRIPELLITELRTEAELPKFKAEFIEFKILSDGNLEGLQVFIASNPKNPLVYEFESVEVTKGQYVVLHLRTLEDSCKNEYGGRINESGGTDSSPTAWDFWIPGKEVLLRKTDVVYVMDKNGWVLDAVIFADKPDAWKGKNYFVEAAMFLYTHDAWKSETGTVPGIEDAVDSAKTTTTRTICRDETTVNTHTASDWYITINSGTTPGKPNNPNRLVQ